MPDFDNDRRRLRGARPLPPRFPSPGSAVMVGQVVSAKPVVGTFMMVNPVSVAGGEAEGAAGVTTADAAVTVPVYLVGPGVPQTGRSPGLPVRRLPVGGGAEDPGEARRTEPVQVHLAARPELRRERQAAQSAFYFVNLPVSQPEPLYTLTYGPRPADIPKDLQLLFYSAPGGVKDPFFVTMPDAAWFSTPVPARIFGVDTHVYFYLWMQSCVANVMVIDAPYGFNTYVGGNTSATKGAGNNVIRYVQTRCQPQFEMKFDLSLPPYLTGAHGADDILPGAGASAGATRTRGAGYDRLDRVGGGRPARRPLESGRAGGRARVPGGPRRPPGAGQGRALGARPEPGGGRGLAEDARQGGRPVGRLVARAGGPLRAGRRGPAGGRGVRRGDAGGLRPRRGPRSRPGAT